MLALSLATEDRVFIIVDGVLQATVQCVEIRNQKTRLGFEADPSVVILREAVVRKKIARGESVAADLMDAIRGSVCGNG